MKKELERLVRDIKIPLSFVAIIWLVYLVEFFTGSSFHDFGVFPRHKDGLIGIITMPFIHGSFKHLFNNSVPLILLGFVLLQSYRRVSLEVLAMIWSITGICLWVAGRESHHIGASGIVYGLAFFIFFSGVFRRDVRSIAATLLVAFFYGSMVWGIFPGQPGISWEGHLFGAVAGTICAFYYRKVDAVAPHEWPDEEPEPAVQEIFWPVQSDELPEQSREDDVALWRRLFIEDRNRSKDDL